jgi:hypothetical protein
VTVFVARSETYEVSTAELPVFALLMPKILRVRDLLRGFLSFFDEALPSSRYLALWILIVQ